MSLLISCSIKIHASGFDQLLESIFCLLLAAEVSTLQKVVEMLEEVVAGWQKVRWIQQMKQNFVAQFVQFLKCWLCDLSSGIIMEKNWIHSVEQYQLEALQFSGHLTDFAEHNSQMWWFRWESERYSGSDQQQNTKQWPWRFFWCKSGSG